MTLLLSVSEFRHQHPDIDSNALRTPWNIPLCDPSGQSYGYRQDVNLRPDLSVLIDDYTLQEDLIVDTSCCHEQEPSLELELSFMLTGHNQTEGIRAGYNFLLAGWEDIIDEDFHWQSGGRVLKFDIHVEASLLNTLIGQSPGGMPKSFLQNLQGLQPGPKSFLHVQSTTAAMRLAIQQLLDCPYQGPTRWLYWEGKVLELIALRLEQISQSAQLSQLKISSDDVDRIHYAGEILRQRLTMPPTLVELAHLVGLNDYTLKKGFRQVFDTTVLGYLYSRRLIYESS
ncbi:MAG: AraC family transcriptional regulator [Cyanobacteria bacterium P01_C01_bin.118]